MLATANTGETRERFEKNAGEWTGRVEISKKEIAGRNSEEVGKNAGEWTRRVEIGKKEIPGSKRSTYGNILTYSRL